MSDTLDIYVRIASDAARYSQGLQGATRETKRFTDTTRSELSKLKRDLAALGLAWEGAKFIQHGIKAAGDLQSAMKDVEGNIKTTTMGAKELADQLAEVRDTAIDVHRAMPYSTKEVVGIENTLLKAGVNIQDVKGKHGATWSVAGLSAISGTDPDTAADLMARIGSQYSLKGDQYGGAANDLMKAEAASPGNLQEIMYNMRQFGSNAHLLGISVKDSAALSAMATPLGMEGGTAVNRFLADSAGKTKTQQKALYAMGLGHLEKGKFKSDFFKDGKYIGIESALDLVKKHLGAVAKKDQAKAMTLASKAWGEEGARFALIAALSEKTKDADKTFAGIKAQMAGALDIAGRMEIKMSGFQQAANAAKGTLEATTALGFEPFLKKLTGVADAINDVAGNTGKWLEKHPEARDNIAWGGAGAGLAAVLGPVAFKVFKSMRGGKGGLSPLKDIGADAIALGRNLAVGKTLQSAAGVTPVFVVNMHESMGGAPPPAPPGGNPLAPEETAAAGAGLSGFLKVLGPALGFGGVAVSMANFTTDEEDAEIAKTIQSERTQLDALKKRYGDATLTKAYNQQAPWFQMGGYENAKPERIQEWVTKYLEGQSQTTQAMISKVQNTDLGGTITVKLIAPPGLQANVETRFNNPAVRALTGRTMQEPN